MSLDFIRHSGIPINGNHSSTYIFQMFFTCSAIFSIRIDLWTPHNIIEDSQSLGLVYLDSRWSPDEHLFIFIHISLFPICCCIWPHELLRSIRGFPFCKSSMWAMYISIYKYMHQTKLVPVLFTFSLYLLNFVYGIYLFLKELYKYPIMMVDFSVSLCGSLSFCFIYFDAML